LKGGLIGNIMVLKSKLIEGEKGLYYNQISWTKNNGESVTQLWELYNEKNELITEIILENYKKKLN
jgi:DNA-binding cell septation regulator SpoVG